MRAATNRHCTELIRFQQHRADRATFESCPAFAPSPANGGPAAARQHDCTLEILQRKSFQPEAMNRACDIHCAREAASSWFSARPSRRLLPASAPGKDCLRAVKNKQLVWALVILWSPNAPSAPQDSALVRVSGGTCSPWSRTYADMVPRNQHLWETCETRLHESCARLSLMSTSLSPLLSWSDMPPTSTRRCWEGLRAPASVQEVDSFRSTRQRRLCFPGGHED